MIDRARESTIQTSECVHHVTDASPFLFNSSRHQTLIKSCHTCQPSILYIHTSPFVSRGGESSFTRRRRSIGDARDDMLSNENSRVVVCRLPSARDTLVREHLHAGRRHRTFGASDIRRIGHSARPASRRHATTDDDDDGGRRRTTTEDDGRRCRAWRGRRAAR